jgi:hypothetical protein
MPISAEDVTLFYFNILSMQEFFCMVGIVLYFMEEILSYQ